MIEVNEYVRTKDGIIDKAIIEYNGKCNNSNCSEKHISCKYNYYNEKDIVKHSKQLIDLIEVGDYVNGHLIVKIRIDPFTKKKQLFTEYWEYNWQGDGTLVVFYDEDIQMILTKESYMANCYKVGGENE
jgi:hypothetical protein